jgi:hypothetical protein
MNLLKGTAAIYKLERWLKNSGGRKIAQVNGEVPGERKIFQAISGNRLRNFASSKFG